MNKGLNPHCGAVDGDLDGGINPHCGRKIHDGKQDSCTGDKDQIRPHGARDGCVDKIPISGGKIIIGNMISTQGMGTGDHIPKSKFS